MNMGPYATLICAIWMVESSGKLNPPENSEDAVGPLQIREICLRDVNESYGMKISHDSCKDISMAALVFRLYIAKYATEKRLGHEPTNEDIARIWNGGPNGWNKVSTEKYWASVKLYLDYPSMVKVERR